LIFYVFLWHLFHNLVLSAAVFLKQKYWPSKYRPKFFTNKRIGRSGKTFGQKIWNSRANFAKNTNLYISKFFEKAVQYFWV
jgi:hypothetical protein